MNKIPDESVAAAAATLSLIQEILLSFSCESPFLYAERAYWSWVLMCSQRGRVRILVFILISLCVQSTQRNDGTLIPLSILSHTQTDRAIKSKSHYMLSLALRIKLFARACARALGRQRACLMGFCPSPLKKKRSKAVIWRTHTPKKKKFSHVITVSISPVCTRVQQ